QKLYEEMLAISEHQDQIFLYPVNEWFAAELTTASPELKAERLDTWTRWKQNKAGIMIAPVAALKRALPPSHLNEQDDLMIKVGEEYPYEQFVTQLFDFGYKFTDMVTTPGEMSRRGGIVDVYPLTE